MRTIPLTKDKAAIVDDADYDWLNKHKWCAMHSARSYTSYAVRRISINKNKVKIELMHRAILGLQPSDKRHTDHRDGNGLNNQRSNLRRCTAAQNCQSSRKRKTGTSKYKGVTWRSDVCKWMSQISLKGKHIHLGYFDSENDAAQAYDKAALNYYGEFALINEPKML